MHTLATALRDLRVQRAMTQSRLAAASRLSLAAINDIETGRRKRVYPSTLAALTRALRSEQPFSVYEVQTWSSVTGLDPRAVAGEDHDSTAGLDSPLHRSDAPIPEEVLVSLAQLLTVAEPHFVIKVLNTAYAVSLRSPMPKAPKNPPEDSTPIPPPIIAPDGVKFYVPPPATTPPQKGSKPSPRTRPAM